MILLLISLENPRVTSRDRNGILFLFEWNMPWQKEKDIV